MSPFEGFTFEAMALIRLISLSLCLCVSEASFVVSEASFMIAQAPEPIWPGAKYDPAIPTLRQVVGHDPGLEITPPDQVGDYLQALAKAAPTRTRLIEYARTWEGRPLWLMVIGSPERIAKLDQVKRDLQRLADPRDAVAAATPIGSCKRAAGRDLARRTASTATRSRRRTRRCSRPITCWRRRATPTSTRCCASRWC